MLRWMDCVVIIKRHLYKNQYTPKAKYKVQDIHLS